MRLTISITVLLCVFFCHGAAGASVDPAVVVQWSNLARRAIVPAGPNGVFGSENFGNKFPGEGAVYIAIVHAAMYDAAVALHGGYRPYASGATAPADTSADAAIATAAHHVLVGLQPALGLSPAQQAIVDDAYAASLAAIADGAPKTSGIAVGEQVANAVLASRAGDGRERNPQLADLSSPVPGPGVWSPGAAPALGLRLPGMRPLVLTSASQFRPDGPNAMNTSAYATDFAEVMSLGRDASARRTEAQTTAALFWTDHDLRQWNDALLRLASERRLDGMQTARMLAMAHAAGGDAMIACFDAKYTFWFWRPYQAIPQADLDGNDSTAPDPAWKPLRPTPNFPEYPSAHACHTTAVVEALDGFFGTDRIRLRVDSRVTGTTREYARLHDAIRDVDWARVLAGFHYRNSDQEGSNLGRKVGRFVVANAFQPSTGAHRPAAQNATARGTRNSTARITASFSDACRDFTAHSDKDLSYVDLRYVSGREEKRESINDPDYRVDGGPGEEIDLAIVKSGTTTEQFDCVQSNLAPAALLEIQTPDNCYPFFSGGILCEQTTPRTVWRSATDVPDMSGGEPGILHWGCGALGDRSLCSFSIAFRGTGSSDPDGDIANWALDFGDGASSSGTWNAAPPTQVMHEYSLDASGAFCGDNVCEITLTVTDASGQSHSNAMRMAFVDQTAD